MRPFLVELPHMLSCYLLLHCLIAIRLFHVSWLHSYGAMSVSLSYSYETICSSNSLMHSYEAICCGIASLLGGYLLSHGLICYEGICSSNSLMHSYEAICCGIASLLGGYLLSHGLICYEGICCSNSLLAILSH